MGDQELDIPPRPSALACACQPPDMRRVTFRHLVLYGRLDKQQRKEFRGFHVQKTLRTGSRAICLRECSWTVIFTRRGGDWGRYTLNIAMSWLWVWSPTYTSERKLMLYEGLISQLPCTLHRFRLSVRTMLRHKTVHTVSVIFVRLLLFQASWLFLGRQVFEVMNNT